MSVTTLPEINRLLSSNAQWATDVERYDPDFFRQTAKGQAPKVLWIGCADSRVPESVIMACKPGEIFVHRNIANQFHLHDDSAQSVLMYAVEALGVEHVVVVGHTKCGGVAAAYDAACSGGQCDEVAPTSPLGRWLGPLVNLASAPDFTTPAATENKDETLRAIVEENVRTQVANIIQSEVIQYAWKASRSNVPGRKAVYVHGWVYTLETGRLRELGVSEGPEGRIGDRFVGGLGMGLSREGEKEFPGVNGDKKADMDMDTRS